MNGFWKNRSWGDAPYSRLSSRSSSTDSLIIPPDMFRTPPGSLPSAPSSIAPSMSSGVSSAAMLAQTGKGQSFTKGMIASSAVSGGFDILSGLIDWGVKKDLMAQNQRYHVSNAKLGADLSSKVFKNNMSTAASYHDKAGVPFLPGGASVGNRSVQFSGNNYQLVNNHTSGIKHSGTQAQLLTDHGSFI